MRKRHSGGWLLIGKRGGNEEEAKPNNLSKHIHSWEDSDIAARSHAMTPTNPRVFGCVFLFLLLLLYSPSLLLLDSMFTQTPISIALCTQVHNVIRVNCSMQVALLAIGWAHANGEEEERRGLYISVTVIGYWIRLLFAIGRSRCHSGSVIAASRAIRRARASQAGTRAADSSLCTGRRSAVSPGVQEEGIIQMAVCTAQKGDPRSPAACHAFMSSTLECFRLNASSSHFVPLSVMMRNHTVSDRPIPGRAGGLRCKAREFLAPVDFLIFALLFWNQILIWDSLRPSSPARFCRLCSVR
ncbi:hypothetical protein EYF80_016343 [Liparis tanakae]|uniref:Uncharacterized protein n=1 Tax=Liparis tanakae TaxID=230148 RepID=A0A4Z2I5Q7_9TELE|nr:hypothetical protein EYF80_016343 [Liparis tanakae]